MRLSPLIALFSILYGSPGAEAQGGDSLDAMLATGIGMAQRAARSELDSTVRLLRTVTAAKPSSAAHAALSLAYANRFSIVGRGADADSGDAQASLARKLDRRNGTAVFAKAIIAGGRGDSATMAKGLARTIALDPSNGRAARILMRYYVNAARYTDAFHLGQRIERDQPRNLVARFHYGWAAGYALDEQRAVGIYRRIIRDDPGGTYAAWSHGELAYLARARGDIQAALRHMEDGRREKADDPYMPVGHATMLLSGGNPARALAILDSVIARDSLATGFGSVPAVLLRAWAARDLGDSAVARTAFAAAERLLRPKADRGDPSGIWYLAAAAALQGKLEEALATADRAIRAGQRPYGSAHSFMHEGWWGRLRDDPAFGDLSKRVKIKGARAGEGSSR